MEVTLCLKKHLSSVHFSSTGTKRLSAYSDSCGGQNQNFNMLFFWLHIVASSDYSYEQVDHKFMVPGLSYLPNDQDFSSIECSKSRLLLQH